jgi:hypothetical protein
VLFTFEDSWALYQVLGLLRVTDDDKWNDAKNYNMDTQIHVTVPRHRQDESYSFRVFLRKLVQEDEGKENGDIKISLTN